MSDQGGDESLRVIMARMEGKLDLSNLRHDQTETRLTDLSNRVHGHANRIQSIEAREHVRDGERKGAALAIKVMWALGGSGVAGALALAARHFAI